LRIGATDGVLHVSQVRSGVEGERDEGVPEIVRVE
jgi:hypothetical protein